MNNSRSYFAANNFFIYYKELYRKSLSLTTKTVTQASMYTIVDGILYYTGQKDDLPRAVMPCGHMMEDHGGVMVGLFFWS